MRKYVIPILMLVAVGLAGCLSQEQTPTLTVARPAPTVVLTVPDESALSPDSGCTVITRAPTPGPTEESIFPPVGETDWVKGPATAKVTIIEYSDFQ
jgi:hypothetical protein